ncbi:hypothetical protein GPALN_012568 [Globodera pallida]|uniref:Protein kinase domain-containing protein n=1 Tax=Globodera pallida TaxID=36090 RepID=A0A183BLM7_GLOPA|nr:hypothetical protein GPALN_012568 [Globodera pallida]
MADQLVELNPGARVAGRWTIVKKLGAGAYGAVYLCKDDNGMQGALKTEPVNTAQPVLAMEACVLNSLHELRAGEAQHFCRCLDIGRDDQQRNTATGEVTSFNFIVMSLVGRALDGLIREAGDRFSPGTALGMAIQLLDAIKTLHSVGYLHRDIKPANATIGRPDSNEQRLLYLIDFGIARKFLREDGTQRRPRAATNFRGTPIYAPIAAHVNSEYSRKDDVESWFYVLIKFYKGAVPWKHAGDVHQMGERKCRRLKTQPADIRRQARAELLEGCPAEFGQILKHIDGLRIEDRPDYEMIASLLRKCLSNNGLQEHPYDWEIGKRNEGDVRNEGGNVRTRSGSSGTGKSRSSKRK